MYTPSVQTTCQRLGRERTKRPTIDSIVNPIVDGVDFLAKFLGINVDLDLVSGDEIVELGIEDSDDLGALVIHDFLILLVPKQRNGESMGLLRDEFRTSDHGKVGGPSRITWFGSEIQILDVFRAVQGIDLGCRVFVDACEGPSVLAHTRGNNRDSYM